MVDVSVLKQLSEFQEVENLIRAINIAEQDMKNAIIKYTTLCGWHDASIEAVVKDKTVVRIWKTDKISL